MTVESNGAGAHRLVPSRLVAQVSFDLHARRHSGRTKTPWLGHSAYAHMPSVYNSTPDLPGLALSPAYLAAEEPFWPAAKPLPLRAATPAHDIIDLTGDSQPMEDIDALPALPRVKKEEPQAQAPQAVSMFPPSPQLSPVLDTSGLFTGSGDSFVNQFLAREPSFSFAVDPLAHRLASGGNLFDATLLRSDSLQNARPVQGPLPLERASTLVIAREQPASAPALQQRQPAPMHPLHVAQAPVPTLQQQTPVREAPAPAPAPQVHTAPAPAPVRQNSLVEALQTVRTHITEPVANSLWRMRVMQEQMASMGIRTQIEGVPMFVQL